MRSPSPYEFGQAQWIAGQWREGRSSRVVDDRDPYTGDTLASLQLADQTDLDDASAFHRAAPILETRRAEIIHWLVHEAGSTCIKGALADPLAGSWGGG